MQTEDSLGLTKKNLYNIKNKIPQGRNFCLLKYIYIHIGWSETSKRFRRNLAENKLSSYIYVSSKSTHHRACFLWVPVPQVPVLPFASSYYAGISKMLDMDPAQQTGQHTDIGRGADTRSLTFA